MSDEHHYESKLIPFSKNFGLLGIEVANASPTAIKGIYFTANLYEHDGEIMENYNLMARWDVEPKSDQERTHDWILNSNKITHIEAVVSGLTRVYLNRNPVSLSEKIDGYMCEAQLQRNFLALDDVYENLDCKIKTAGEKIYLSLSDENGDVITDFTANFDDETVQSLAREATRMSSWRNETIVTLEKEMLGIGQQTPSM